VLWAVVGGSLLGIGLGYALGQLLNWVERRRHIDHYAIGGYAIALTFLALALPRVFGMNDILALFLAGVAFTITLTRKHRVQYGATLEMLDPFFMLPVFFLFGAILPWQHWLALGWKAPLIVVGILLLRRLPFVLLLRPLLRRQLRSMTEAAFVGWFGPMGVSALFYVMLVMPLLHNQLVWDVSSLIITSSVLMHGLTAVPFSRRLARVSKSTEEE